MKLSEAIRLGAMMKPQAFGKLRRVVYFYKGEPRQEIRTCALGAALDACGLLMVEDVQLMRFDNVFVHHPEIIATLLQCCRNPMIESGRTASVHEVIVYLNDNCRWSREQIADWVACIEQRVEYEVFEEEVEVPEAICA